jgi:hypothetical protein
MIYLDSQRSVSGSGLGIIIRYRNQSVTSRDAVPPDCSLTWGLRNLNASMLVDHGTVCVTFMIMIQPDGLA